RGTRCRALRADRTGTLASAVAADSVAPALALEYLRRRRLRTSAGAGSRRARARRTAALTRWGPAISSSHVGRWRRSPDVFDVQDRTAARRADCTDPGPRRRARRTRRRPMGARICGDHELRELLVLRQARAHELRRAADRGERGAGSLCDRAAP